MAQNQWALAMAGICPSWGQLGTLIHCGFKNPRGPFPGCQGPNPATQQPPFVRKALYPILPSNPFLL